MSKTRAKTVEKKRKSIEAHHCVLKMSNAKQTGNEESSEEKSDNKKEPRKVVVAPPKRRNSVNFNHQVLVGVAPNYDRKITVRLPPF